MNHFEQLARDLAEIYILQPKVEGVMLAGSVARGLCDTHSDIELYILWKDAPSDSDRKQVIELLDGEILSFFDYEDEEWSEAYRVKGIKIEVSSFLTSTIDRVITKVFQEKVWNIDHQAIAASIQDGIPLEGKDVIASFKSRCADFPRELQKNMVESQLFFSSRWAARQAFLDRQDFFIYQKTVSEVIEKILTILHGVNSMFIVHPGFKWLSYTLSKMTVKPDGMENRIRSILTPGNSGSVIELENLLLETIGIVDTALPEIDLTAFRKDMKGSRVED
ncbi:nucleotidyltransferase domain-containing protein [Peribacillus kribbensis]|uniref:nucleotidyltransferase domain-containing protein n=1 Tax=Peribacillus kribbensis TaxID=356658 RepID=UPI00047BE172|nr:nucleotidyltransferase domain-containing protein [Peribacillus kribbensis]